MPSEPWEISVVNATRAHPSDDRPCRLLLNISDRLLIRYAIYSAVFICEYLKLTYTDKITKLLNANVWSVWRLNVWRFEACLKAYVKIINKIPLTLLFRRLLARQYKTNTHNHYQFTVGGLQQKARSCSFSLVSQPPNNASFYTTSKS